ncbi:hypothetical protein KY285_036429 [Solanum tuberosum]|nr:hypothetical protein KY285_036429 [Solanum tuberosum]
MSLHSNFALGHRFIRAAPDRAQLAQSISGWSAWDGQYPHALRASPSGWCCVAQGSVVRVYNWMLEEHPMIHIEHNKVNDVCWVDSESIVVTSDKNLANGDIELFNASTGELRYKFQVTDRSSGLISSICHSKYTRVWLRL